ncbi:serine hydrolase domain-containing protein [Paenibacillus thalictri]|uniref:Class C beta-lactamase-related serine hydrolase n=1 Tax=Paenibacillus thalictri TaxID=2527873 RepID=A0A4Q9DMP6_9BACL|nr:serine hydrolase [Paenibacillus thalictri]TBL76620.1 class C beta-lactamase-related serine hydrolase [Paenibacillus thalictri]
MRLDQALPRSRPEALGISPQAVTDFLQEVVSGQVGLHSFMLVRHGQVAAEAWWQPYGPQLPHMLFSLSKSFTSTAVGFAVAEGKLSVDDLVVDFFPDKEILADHHLKSMRVRHLLSMSTGHAKDTMGALGEREDKDWVQAFLQLPVEYESGTVFVYNSGASYMLSAIVQRITGETLLEYLHPRLFEPLGIAGATWQTCPLGISAGGWGLSLRTEHIASFGQLYLQKGYWNGKQLLPREWVEEATAFHIQNSSTNTDWSQGYGYQFWRCQHGAYRGDGAFGQFCIVIPEQDAVVAITSGLKNMQQVLDLVWKHLLPGLLDEPLPANDGQFESLSTAIRSLAYLPLPQDEAQPALTAYTGKRFVFADNSRKLESGSIDFAEDECIVTLRTGQGEEQVRCGFGSWSVGAALGHALPVSQIAASGKWLNANSFEMEWRYIETPFTDTITVRLDEAGVTFELNPHIYFGEPKEALVLSATWE